MNKHWGLCFKYRSLATMAKERGEAERSNHYLRLAANQEKKAQHQDYQDEHYGVFVWGGAPILEPGDKEWLQPGTARER